MFIEAMRKEIKFKVLIVNTAMLLFHRFYMYQSMEQFKWKELAWCCLFAAFKIEEVKMPMNSILKWSHHVTCLMAKQTPTKIDVHGREFFERKERLQYNERILLQTLGFAVDNINIQSLAYLVINCVKQLKLKSPIYTADWGKQVAEVAYDWCNYSYGSELCLMYPPQVIACAMVYGAAHDVFGRLVHPRDRKMWELVSDHSWSGVSKVIMSEDTLHEVMTEFHSYCNFYKLPREHWKWMADPSQPMPTVAAPPKDPARYHPNAPPSPVAAATVVTGAAVTTTGAPSEVGSASAESAAPPHTIPVLAQGERSAQPISTGVVGITPPRPPADAEDVRGPVAPATVLAKNSMAPASAGGGDGEGFADHPSKRIRKD